jgi:uncharacterized membrane protein YGL010W
MKSILDQLGKYATYHRDRRNVATHFVGIPMIVVATEALLSRPQIVLGGGFAATPALALSIAAVAYYVALDLRFGLAMAAFLGASMYGGAHLAALGTGAWLASSIGTFVVGWIFQFVGHYFEGKKPAFVDDMIGFLIGPLFIVAEAGFALGLRTELRDAIELRSSSPAGSAVTA